MAGETAWTVKDGWLTARDGRATLLEAGPERAVLLTVDDEETPPQRAAKPETRSLGDGVFEVEYAWDGGELTDRWTPFPELGEAYRRTVTYTNRSGASKDLTDARLYVMPKRAEDGEVWRPDWFWMGESAKGRAVCLAYQGTTDY